MKINYFFNIFIFAFILPLYAQDHFEFEGATSLKFSTTVAASVVNKPQKEPWITIWVHGTRLLFSHVFKKFFDVPHGLIKALDLSDEYHHHCIAQTLCTTDHCLFDLDHFYLFGWSGSLSFAAREQAAQELQKDLGLLLAKYHDKNINPRLRIITHSHGGNVVLNLARFNTPVTIDELILLACPVQDQTKNYTKNSMFKQIISIYSTWDSIQIADPQGLYSQQEKWFNFSSPIFSGRTFPLQSNLFQVQLWHNDRGPMHLEFLLCESLAGIVQLLPKIISETKHHFSSQFAVNEPKPIQKLKVTSKGYSAWKEKTKQILSTAKSYVSSMLPNIKKAAYTSGP